MHGRNNETCWRGLGATRATAATSSIAQTRSIPHTCGPSLAGAAPAPQHPTNARRGGHGRARSIIARQPGGQPHTTCSAYRPAEVVILGLIAAVGPRAVASSHAADFMGSSGRLHLFLSKTAETRDLEDKFEISSTASQQTTQTHSVTILARRSLGHLHSRSHSRLSRLRADADAGLPGHQYSRRAIRVRAPIGRVAPTTSRDVVTCYAPGLPDMSCGRAWSRSHHRAVPSTVINVWPMSPQRSQ